MSPLCKAVRETWTRYCWPPAGHILPSAQALLDVFAVKCPYTTDLIPLTTQLLYLSQSQSLTSMVFLFQLYHLVLWGCQCSFFALYIRCQVHPGHFSFTLRVSVFVLLPFLYFVVFCFLFFFWLLWGCLHPPFVQFLRVHLTLFVVGVCWTALPSSAGWPFLTPHIYVVSRYSLCILIRIHHLICHVSSLHSC